MAVVSMKQLLECGVHFGHQTRRWNPKMKPYIFTERNGVYIIDLQKTVRGLDKAYDFIRTTASEGGTVLFVGTKRQAQDTIRDEATRCGQHFINQRWLGGLMTNFPTIRKRVQRMLELRKYDEDNTWEKFSKKELAALRKEQLKLEKYLGGIAKMTAVPDAIFLIDPRREENAIADSMSTTLNIRHWGNSLGVRLPASIARAAGLSVDQQVEVAVEGDRIVLTPVRKYSSKVTEFNTKPFLETIESIFIEDRKSVV